MKAYGQNAKQQYIKTAAADRKCLVKTLASTSQESQDNSMSKSRVGSLYFEVLLDADGVEKGAAKLRKAERDTTAFIKKQQKEVLSARQQARVEAERLAKANWEANKHDHERRAQISKMIILDYKARVKAIEAEEIAHQQKMQQIRDGEFISAGKGKLDAAVGRKKLLSGIQDLGAIAPMSQQISRGFDKAAMSIGKVTMAVFPLVVVFSQLKRVVGFYIGTMVDFVKAADEKTKSLITLKALYGGNAEVADKLRESLVRYAKQTSFSVDETMQLAIQLRALGFEADESVSAIKKFGKLSFGDPAKMKLIAKAYSDVRAQGKLMATEVRQFANQGVPLLMQLQDQMGLTAAEVKDKMKAGLIGFKDVDEAITAIANRYGNIDRSGLRTFTGQMEAAREAANELKASIAELSGLDDDLRDVAEQLNVILDYLNEMAGREKSGDGFSWFKALGASIKSVGETALKQIPGLKELLFLLDTYNTLTGKEGRDDLKKQSDELEKELEDVSRANAEAERAAAAESERINQKLHDADMKRIKEKAEAEEKARKAAKRYMDERTRLMRDARGLVGPEDAIVAYKEGLMSSGMSQTDAEMLAELKKQTMIAEEQASLAKLDEEMIKREDARRERMLNQNLPGKMRQNSIEEYIYLKTARDNAEREQKAEARWQEEMRLKREQHTQQITAIDNISVNIQGSDLATH